MGVQNPSVRVYTLGRFQVEVGGAPLQFGRKIQRKPLDLLKVLIAHGGEKVPNEAIADTLWPDSEGDRALAALRQTLSRLRRLVGNKAVLGEDRGLTINEQICWVDALEFARTPELSVYRGEFLPGCDLPPVLSARARLHALFLSFQRRAGHIEGTAAALSIAVPPFDDLSPVGDHRRLAEAIRQTVLSLLAAQPQASLIAVESRNAKPAARYLMRGSITVSAGKVRASVRVIDGRTSEQAWSEDFEHHLEEFGSTRDEIAIRVAHGLAMKLISGDCASLLLSPDVHAWKAATLAIALLTRQTRADSLRAKALLQRALEEQPDHPGMLSVLGNMYLQIGWKRWRPDPAAWLRKGEGLLRLLQKRYGGGGPGVHGVSWACALRGELDEAVRLAYRRMEFVPDNFQSHAFAGIALLYRGRYAEALDKIRDGTRLRPQPLHWLLKDQAVLQFCLGRYEEAAEGLAAMLADPLHRDCSLLDSRMIHVASLAAAGKVEQARHEANATLAAHPTVSSHGWCEWQFQPYQDKLPAAHMERLLIAAGLPH